MDKKSGVYYVLTDNSLRAGGSSGFGGIVPMYTIKGEIGKLIKVSSKDYRDKLGFDLRYNPNYAGLDEILSTVAFVDVLRCNKNPTVAYKVWNGDGSPISAVVYGSADAVEFGAINDTVWVSCSSPGSWGNDLYVCFSVNGVIGNVNTVYTLNLYSVERGVSSLIKKYDFSLNEESEIFYKNVYFGGLVFGFKGVFPTDASFFVSTSTGLPQDERFKLNPGDDGEKLSSPIDIRTFFPFMDSSSANVVVLNGFIETPQSSIGLIKAIMNYCGEQDRSVFLDAPVLVDPDSGILRANDDLFEWSTNLLDANVGQYAQVASVPDVVEIDGQQVLIAPSVKLFSIYANMFSKFGHVNFPPAGNSYGSVSTNSLMKSDFDLHGDELKTKRINYLTKTSRGICMWEYRTLYSLGNSDLSYANAPFILRDLKGRLIDCALDHNFRYSTPIDLLTFRSGLSSVFDYFVREHFLVNYTLNVPSFEEAQAAGKELEIEMGVSVINSADVITLRMTLYNAATLRAA